MKIYNINVKAGKTMHNEMFFVLLCQLIPQVKTQPPVDLHRIYKKFNLV